MVKFIAIFSVPRISITVGSSLQKTLLNEPIKAAFDKCAYQPVGGGELTIQCGRLLPPCSYKMTTMTTSNIGVR